MYIYIYGYFILGHISTKCIGAIWGVLGDAWHPQIVDVIIDMNLYCYNIIPYKYLDTFISKALSYS